MSANPYAPPQAQLETGIPTQCSRDGKFVIVKAGSDLPPRCIICNEPAETPIRKTKLHWHSPWFYLLILINVLIYCVVGFIVGRSVKISPGLCLAHASKRRRRIFMFTIGGGIAVITAIPLMMTHESDGAIVMLLLAFLVLIIGMLSSRKVYAKKITKEYARIGGCKEPFLASLE